MKREIYDIEIEKQKQREKDISKVVNRYIKMKLKKNVRKLFGLNLRWKLLKWHIKKLKWQLDQIYIATKKNIYAKSNIKTTLNFS